MLKRIQSARPCRDVARDDLLRDYNNQILFGCSVAAAHPIQRHASSPYEAAYSSRFEGLKGSSSVSAAAGTVGRTRPQSAQVRGTRPLSATQAAHKKRPVSAKTGKGTTSGYGSKPAWESGW